MADLLSHATGCLRHTQRGPAPRPSEGPMRPPTCLMRPLPGRVGQSGLAPIRVSVMSPTDGVAPLAHLGGFTGLGRRGGVGRVAGRASPERIRYTVVVWRPRGPRGADEIPVGVSPDDPPDADG